LRRNDRADALRSYVFQLFGSKFANAPVIVALFAVNVLHLYIGFDSGSIAE
jgi:hypothetical protein